MSTRDLAAELAHDDARAELAALRELRDAVLETAEMLKRAKTAYSTPADKGRTGIMFDDDGCGPIVVVTPTVINELVALARKATR